MLILYIWFKMQSHFQIYFWKKIWWTKISMVVKYEQTATGFWSIQFGLTKVNSVSIRMLFQCCKPWLSLSSRSTPMKWLKFTYFSSHQNIWTVKFFDHHIFDSVSFRMLFQCCDPWLSLSLRSTGSTPMKRQRLTNLSAPSISLRETGRRHSGLSKRWELIVVIITIEKEINPSGLLCWTYPSGVSYFCH